MNQFISDLIRILSLHGNVYSNTHKEKHEIFPVFLQTHLSVATQPRYCHGLFKNIPPPSPSPQLPQPVWQRVSQTHRSHYHQVKGGESSRRLHRPLVQPWKALKTGAALGGRQQQAGSTLFRRVFFFLSIIFLAFAEQQMKSIKTRPEHKQGRNTHTNKSNLIISPKSNTVVGAI